MLIFRTILLWLAFVLLVFFELSVSSDLRLGIIYRLIPSFLLVIWFIVYFFSRQRYVFKKGINKNSIWILSIFKSIANTTIICGAILKIGHLPFSQVFIIVGIGFLAFWSTVFIVVSEEKSIYNPEIVDDMHEDTNED